MNQGNLFSDTLDEARARVREGRASKDGIDCPCCGQKCKNYRRRLNKNMVKGLLALFKATSRTVGVFRHVDDFLPPEIASKGGTFALLAFWGIVREKPNEDEPTKNRSGVWAVTIRGLSFLQGARVPEAVYTYNGGALRFEEATVTIHDALGVRFDYRELREPTE